MKWIVRWQTDTEKHINIEQINREIQKRIDDNYTSRNCKNTGTTFRAYICRRLCIFILRRGRQVKMGRFSRLLRKTSIDFVVVRLYRSARKGKNGEGMGWWARTHFPRTFTFTFGIATHRRHARLILISKLIIERNNIWFYNVRIFWDHSLLRTFVLSRPYVSLKQKNMLFLLRKSRRCICSREHYLKITFSISIDRRPSEWLGGSRDLISSRIRDSVIPGDVRSADSKALRSSSTAPPFLPPLPPSPLLSLAEYWCFRWSCNIIRNIDHSQ